MLANVISVAIGSVVGGLAGYGMHISKEDIKAHNLIGYAALSSAIVTVIAMNLI